MNRYSLMILTLLTAQAETFADDPVLMKTERLRAVFSGGHLSSLEDDTGHPYLQPATGRGGTAIHRTGTTHYASDGFDQLGDAKADCSLKVDELTGDVIFRQECSTSEKGVWGLSWSIGRIPLDHSIIVPGRSGIRLTAEAPGRQHQFDYPLGWEAQLVIVEGPNRGFYVWAEDVQGRFKRLVVQRDDDGWLLRLITINYAPFDELQHCQSVAWHLNVYQGDWRVPARRYRDWAEKHFCPTPIERRKPAWVKHVRAMVIMGMNGQMLETLAERLDPAQTVVYVPSWRAAGYDRDYPVYDQPHAQLKPFVELAHQLGFRVMLHVNYFGVDPLNSLYGEFEPYQVRDPWGNHEKQWWLWTRAEPEIRFAYINPALKAWRDRFTAAMVQLCRDYRIDALHLDQTLCIFNDHNGLIEGQSMIEGNLALHRQLREALPEVALSGEGLNEITYRHEAFAQRHAWGLNHADGTWDRRWLRLAHPVSSYLFRPYTTINGYLGVAPPTDGQLYAAWNEAYEHWGVIPTLKPDLQQITGPTGFSRQFFDEAAFWQQQRLDIDLEGEWPDEVAFPYRTADGRRSVRTSDGRFTCGDRQISRTISGVEWLEARGNVPGWRAYDEHRLLGLDRQRWYPYFDEPRDSNVFHIYGLPAELVAEEVVSWDDLAMIRTRSHMTVVADLAEMLDKATCGSRPFDGEATEATGQLASPDGARFESQGDSVFTHPPWMVRRTDPQTGEVNTGGSGVAYARYTLDLPPDGRLRLLADVAMDGGAVGEGKTDGVTFNMVVRCGDEELRGEVHNATDRRRRMELDLTSLAGRRVTVEMTVHPGPNLSPSFDWARWYRPRIERDIRTKGDISVASSQPWSIALDESGPVRIESQGHVRRVRAGVPGAVFFLRQRPAAARLPVDIALHPRQVGFMSETNGLLTKPPVAGAAVGEATVGGVRRGGLSVHPPNQGRTLVYLPMSLPSEPCAVQSWVGIRDGSRSTGVVFAVQVNGREVARRRMLPGKWEAISADLSPWKGTPIVLSLVTDSDGPFNFDWACWGETRIDPQ